MKGAKTLVIEMDQAELACRLIEGMYGVKRPVGITNEAALSVMGPEDRDAVMRGAMEAMRYFQECSQRRATVQ